MVRQQRNAFICHQISLMLASVFIPNRNNLYAWMNLIFLIGFLLLGKIEPYTVLFGYFLETIIIGFFNVLKMILASRNDGSGKSIFFYVPFFIFHYGVFVAVQSVFVILIVGMDGTSFLQEPFHLIDTFIAIMQLKGMSYILILLFGTQVMKFIFDFVLPKKYLDFSANEIMFMPYVRIFIQQFTVILAMFFTILGSVSIIAALILILLRAIVDLGLVSIRENTKFLEYLVNRSDDGKTSKETIRKQLLLFSE